MPEEQLITKVTQIFQREDASEVRIIAQASWMPSGKLSDPHTEVCRRKTPNHNWESCNPRPHPDWLTMPVDQYLKEGRSEMLQAVTIGELLKVSSLIGKPMSTLQ